MGLFDSKRNNVIPFKGAPAGAPASVNVDDFLKAVRAHDTQAMAAALAAGLDPGATDANGRTILLWAVATLQPAVVETLLAARPDVNVVTAGGQSALMHATYLGS